MMKIIEQLGISPAPWGEREWGVNDAYFGAVEDDGEDTVCRLETDDAYLRAQLVANARLIAAAPCLYECLREAVLAKCWNCRGVQDGGETCGSRRQCIVKRWRAALEKAGGADA